MSADKIMRCMASLSDALNTAGASRRIELHVILDKPFREVIEKLLAPNGITFYRPELNEDEIDEDEIDEDYVWCVTTTRINDDVLFYWTGRDWSMSRDSAKTYTNKVAACAAIDTAKFSAKGYTFPIATRLFVSAGDEEEPVHVEREEPESFGFHIVCYPKTGSKWVLYWTGTAFLRQSSSSMRFGSFDKAEEIMQRLLKEKGAKLPDPKKYHSPSVEAITEE